MLVIAYEALIIFFAVSLAFFCAAETAIMSASRHSLKALAIRKRFGAVAALELLDYTDEAISTMLIGTNISHISATALITYIASVEFGASPSMLLAISMLQTVIFLLFCELFPKVFARARTDWFLCTVSHVILIIMKLFKPLVTLSLLASRMIKKGTGMENATHLRSRDEINQLFKLGEKSGVITQDYREFVDEVLEMNEVMVREIMTPTISITAIEEEESVRTLIRLIDRTHYSRIPVFRERVDNIIGYVHYRDFMISRPETITSVMKPAVYVPETKLIYELFHEMTEDEIDIVCAVNEYGAVTGIATREDIAEEIFGEIQTREHQSQDLIVPLGRDRYQVSGTLDIDIFEREFSIETDKKHYDTVAGYILKTAGRIPRTGERIAAGGLIFTVTEADPRSVKSVIVRKTASTAS